MNRPTKDESELGTVTTLLRRSALRRTPRLLAIKKMVDRGERLSEVQIIFLTQVFADAQRAIPYVDSHPELQELARKTAALYHDITEQALKNEEAPLKAKLPPIDL